MQCMPVGKTKSVSDICYIASFRFWQVQTDSTLIITADALVAWRWHVAQSTVHPACYSDICNGGEAPQECILYPCAVSGQRSLLFCFVVLL